MKRAGEEDEKKISKQLKILFFESQFVRSSHGGFLNGFFFEGLRGVGE